MQSISKLFQKLTASSQRAVQRRSSVGCDNDKKDGYTWQLKGYLTNIVVSPKTSQRHSTRRYSEQPLNGKPDVFWQFDLAIPFHSPLTSLIKQGNSESFHFT
jgi:hypothetical protein